jgi:hypothetical protein
MPSAVVRFIPKLGRTGCHSSVLRHCLCKCPNRFRLRMAWDLKTMICIRQRAEAQHMRIIDPVARRENLSAWTAYRNEPLKDLCAP